MVFSSTIFLFLFLPCVCFAFWAVKRGLRQYVLLLASLLFYAWGNPKHVVLLLFVILISYISAIQIDGSTTASRRKLWLMAGIAINLGLLFRFKYFDFCFQILSSLSGYTFSPHHYSLPIGISFFTFQALSYLIDVYRQEVEAQRDFLRLALYISFFPQLIAGPIVKYHEILPDIERNNVCFYDVISGTKRFIIGLGKKVLLANQLGTVADKIFDTGAVYADFSIAWLGAITYSLQLYFDFSGYSDMAIGLGRIFGFHFNENFNHPYLSQSISEFWRRWHISLGTWFREYLYIPLGGNRCSAARTYANLLFIFLVTGLWHGANWTFVIWGLWHGIFVVLERLLVPPPRTSSIVRLWRHSYTICVFVFGWVMFRAETLSEAFGFWRAMAGLYSPDALPFTVDYYLTRKLLLILGISLVACTSWPHGILANAAKSPSLFQRATLNIYMLSVLFISIVFLVASKYNPFIYFRF